MEALGLDRPYVVGCSIGGKIALDPACRLGKRLGGAVAMAADAGLDPAAGRAMARGLERELEAFAAPHRPDLLRDARGGGPDGATRAPALDRRHAPPRGPRRVHVRPDRLGVARRVVQAAVGALPGPLGGRRRRPPGGRGEGAARRGPHPQRATRCSTASATTRWRKSTTSRSSWTAGCATSAALEIPKRLALQLRSAFQVRALCGGLVGASPERPGDDVSGADAPLGEAGGDASDFLDRPADEGGRSRGSRGALFGGDAWFARWRTRANMA